MKIFFILEIMIMSIVMIYLDLALIIYFFNNNQLSYIGNNNFFWTFLFFYIRDNSSAIKYVSHKEILKTISQ